MRKSRKRGLIKSCGYGNMSNLSKLLSRTHKAWPLALHLSQTPEKMCQNQTFFNVAMPSGSSEYYIMSVCKGDVAEIQISQNAKKLCIFHNVSVYNMDGSLWNSQYDKDSMVKINNKHVEKNPEILGSKSKMIVKGPAILCTRFYKPYTLLSLWALELDIMPHVVLNGKVMDLITLEESKQISSSVTHAMEKKITYDRKTAEMPAKELYDMRRDTPWRRGVNQQNFFIPLKGKVATLFPNIHSVYSFYHLENDLALINIRFYNNIKIGGINVKFTDLMVCDTKTTRTDNSISGDLYPNLKQILVYKEGVKIPLKFLEKIKSGTIHLLQFRKETTPLLIYRMVHVNAPKSILIDGITSTDSDEIACYILKEKLTAPLIIN